MATILQHSDWLNGRVPDSVRAHLRQLVEVVGYLPHRQPLGVITADAVLLAANRPFLDLLGASGDEQLGADWDDFMPGWSERTGALGGEGELLFTQAFEDYLLPCDGKPVWVRVVACPVFTPEPAAETGTEVLAAWALFVLDQRPGAQEVDEHRRGAILDLLLESPREFVVQLDPDGRLRYLSPSLRRALGVFADGAEGKPIGDLHLMGSPAFSARFPAVMESLLGPPYGAEFEMTLTTTEGDHVVDWRFQSLLSDGGTVEGILGAGHDVTEHRRAEAELAESELRLRTLVESTNQVVWTAAPGGAMDGPTDSWSRFTGQTEQEACGDGWTEVIHPDDRQRVLRAWATALAEREVFACDYRLRRADGAYRWIEARAVPLPGPREPRYFGVGHDITARKRAEETAQRRVELETMVASVSSRFASADFDMIPEAVDFALAETGRHLGADRVSLFLLAQDGERLDGVREWLGETGTCSDGDVSLGARRLDRMLARSPHGEALVPRGPNDLPTGAEVEPELLEGVPGAVLAVQVLQEQTLVGVLAYEMDATERDGTAAASSRRWGDEDVSLVRLVADQLASAYLWRWDELNLRAVADGFLAFGPDAGRNLSEVCRAAAAVTGADVVLYTRRQGGRLVTETGWNIPEGLPWTTAEEGRLDAAVLERTHGEVWVVQDLPATPYAETSPIVRLVGARVYAGFAVEVEGKTTGALSCLFAHDVTLRESQLELLRVLRRAITVEEERRLALEDRFLGMAQLEQAMERMVITLSGAVSARDPYTAGHEERVGELSVAVGRRLGLEADDLRLLRLAAIVHDLGKISVPAEILSKPVALSDAEFAIIRGHAEAGWAMLEPAGLPASVTDAVLQHHERLDGSGYPHGLRDDEIGLFARIIAVADVVEAMSSHRPYRPAIGIAPALEEIEQGAGSRYDAAATEACLRLFREEGFTFSS